MNQMLLSLYIFILLLFKLACGDIITLPLKSSTMNHSQKDQNGRFLQDSTNSHDNKLTILGKPVYVVEIQLGKSETSMKVQVDTGSNVLWVSGDSCAECKEKLQENTYTCDQSDDCIIDTNQEEDSEKYGDGTKVTGQIAKTPMKIGDLTIEQQPFLSVTKGENFVASGFDGMMGLSLIDNYDVNKKNWVQRLFEQKKISSNSFSVYLTFNDDSRLTVGGYNKNFVKDSKPITYHTVTDEKKWILSSSKITFGDASTQDGVNIVTILDTGAGGLFLPPALFDQMLSFLKTKFQLEIQPHIGNDKLCEVADQLPELVFNILDESNQNVQYSLSSKDYVFKEKGQCFFGLTKIPESVEKHQNDVILGTVFHFKYLVVYEYSPNRIGIVESTSEAPSLESDNSFSNNSKKLLFWNSLFQYIAILYIILIQV